MIKNVIIISAKGTVRGIYMYNNINDKYFKRANCRGFFRRAREEGVLSDLMPFEEEFLLILCTSWPFPIWPLIENIL